ncbi:phosphomannose isomerase type II C-terminal cupin domain [Bacteroides sp.]|uniref:phosphomannose isomerase type II C-terminal cupin domain n=1 Tax=Bacteroides sp. TaxID=29523 RepID=UPI002627F98D|nr:phosphomannose isomerase type II C-terminal cupin domain [Bacteroides sp.]MDD3039567.1 phosphomannose isomerase type II C-terminal cupin domain [Bacteroides sp.]
MRIDKPWGYMEVVDSTTFHKFKTIVVFPEQQLSLQYHVDKVEFWVITEGDALVTLNDETYLARPGWSFFIFAGDKHRIKNISTEHDLVFVELAGGKIVSEEDIVRVEDAYGRVV